MPGSKEIAPLNVYWTLLRVSETSPSDAIPREIFLRRRMLDSDRWPSRQSENLRTRCTCENKQRSRECTKRNRRYPAKTITDADYADDIAILANTPNQAETLLHSLERAVAGIGLHVNAHITEYMCYNQTGNISTQEWWEQYWTSPGGNTP